MQKPHHQNVGQTSPKDQFLSIFRVSTFFFTIYSFFCTKILKKKPTIYIYLREKSIRLLLLLHYDRSPKEKKNIHTATTSRLSSYHCERLVIIIHIVIANSTFLLFTLTMPCHIRTIEFKLLVQKKKNIFSSE